jgi:hypothetical protein
MLAVLTFGFTSLTNASTVKSDSQKAQITQTMEHSTQVMSDAQLHELIIHEPPAVEAEIVHINSLARDCSMQWALLVPALAALLGLIAGFRMRRLPEITPKASLDGLDMA